jgi:hypothetical protein
VTSFNRARMPVFRAAGRLDLRWRYTVDALTYEEVAEVKEWLSRVLPKLS